MCQDVCIEINEVVENISIEVRDFSVSNIISQDNNNSATIGSDGLLFVSENVGGASWGEIDGTLSNQTDLQNSLNLKANESDLGAVAFSNDYNDLSNKPTIPSVTNLVPYTGATENVDLGANSLSTVSVINESNLDYNNQVDLSQDGVYLNSTDITTSNTFKVTPTSTDSKKIIIAPSLQFNTLAVETSEVGKLKWNDTDGTLDLGLKGGNVTLQIGQENVVRVVNKSGSNLLESNYQVVRIRKQAEGGASGQRLAVKLAQADTKANHSAILGLVTEDINNNQEGFVTVFGNVNKINTTGSLQGQTWNDGDDLWLSESVAGGLTNIEPTVHPVRIGHVIYAHSNNGKIYLSLDNGVDELNELHNVKITDVQNNDSLSYNSSLQVWENKAIINQSNKGVFTGGITWTGTTAPSGTTSHSYNWQKVGNLVTLNVTLFYQNSGTALTSVAMDFMNDFPTPLKPDGLTNASEVLYNGSGDLRQTATSSGLLQASALLRSNASNNGFQLVVTQGSISAKIVKITIQYFTA